MPNTSDLLSKVQQANLYFANLMDKYVDSFVYSLERDEKINAKVNDLYELLEAMDFQLAKGLYYDNENTKLIYQKIDCVTPIYNTYITIDTTLIKPFISNTIQSQAAWGGITGDINNQQDLIGLFSLKQNNITLTTTGSSGAATLIGATLNIPQYTDQFVGTVTSVGLTSATSGVTIGNSPITSSGNITLAIASASGSQNGLLSSTDWTTFNAKQGAITLTTTGSSGASTLIGNTLNVPNYSGALGGYVTLDTTQTITGAKTFGATITSNRINATGTGDGAAVISAFAFDNSVAGSFRNDTTLGENSPTLFVQQNGDGRIALFQSDTANVIIESDGDIDGVKDLTLTSTIKKSTISTTYTYNLPDANGTIALVGGAGVGTVTSVAALTLGTTGTDLSSTVANSTTTPVITLNVPTASASNRGALSSTDWTTFNSKQDALNGTGFVKISGTTISYDNSTYLTTIEGIVASGELSGTYASPTLVNSAVIGKVLTGLNVTGGTVASTDSILQAFGKVQNQINGLIGGSIFQGTWNASTNTPALASGVGTNGHYYIVSVDGSTNLDGITDWKVGDWAIFAGTTWEKVDNTDAVGSVNGYTGTVSLVTGDVLEGAGTLPSRPSQLYFTDARARAAISLTTSGSSGASTYDNGTGVLNIPNYGSALTAYVPYSGATSDINLGAFNITASSLIKAGGVDTQFLKADGSVDNNNYLTANDLPSTLSLYATNVAAAVAGYFKLVTTIEDPDYNTIAVDVPTGEITIVDQLIASLVSPVNLINGNPGVFNVTTTGNITKLSGTGLAEFFFRIYKRDSAGVETLVGTSGNTIPVTNSGYSEFFTTAIWNDGVFGVTDSIVLKYYANRVAGGSNPTYQFQFGGDQPVRTTVPIPTAVIPNIFLEQLADVEDGVEANNDGIFFDSSVSLWKYKSVAEVLGYTPANDASVVHLTGDETISDFKTFTNTVKITNGSANGLSLEIGTSGTYSSLKAATSGSSTNIILPASSGTLALTSDLSAYVTLATTQTITGAKTFSLDAFVNGVSIGRGGGSLDSNTRVGRNAINLNTTGIANSAFGNLSLERNTTGNNNSSFGNESLRYNTTGNSNVGFGNGALATNTTGGNNIAIGENSGRYITGLAENQITNNSIYIGWKTKALANNQTNQIVIGHDATGLGSNTTVLGNSSTVFGRFWGNLLIGDSTNSGEALQITGTSKFSGRLNVIAQGTLLTDIAFSVRNSANTTNLINIAGNGNVGINNISPPQRLSLAAGNGLSFQNTLGSTGTYGGIYSYNDLVNTTTPATAIRFIRDIANIGADGAIAFDTNNVPRVLITSTGRILLGSTTDNTVDRLQVTGSVNVTGQLKLGSTITNNSFTYTLPSATGTLALTSDLSAYVTLATTQTITGAKTFSLDTIVNGLTVGRGGGSNITNSAFGFSTLEVNTGIANTAIGYRALVNNTSGFENVALGHSAGSFINISGLNQTSTNSVYLGNDTRASASGNTNEIVIGHSARGGGSNSATLGNTSISKTILHGNTSIGYTTNPSLYKLDVNGSGRFASTSYSNLIVDGTNASGWGNNIVFKSQGTDFGYLGSIGSLLGTTTKDMTVWSTSGNGFRVNVNGSSTSAFTIASTGAATFSSSVSAGGTTTVNAQTGTDGIFANVSGGVVGFKITQANPVNDALFRMQTNGHFYDLRATSSNALTFDYDGSPRMAITSGGNVGIGTTTPGAKLHTVSAVGDDSARFTDNFNYTLAVRRLPGSIGGMITGTETSAIGFGTDNTERMRITSGGNVGIGTTSPSAILHTQVTNAGAESKGLIIQNVGSTANTAISLIFAPHESTSSPETLAKITAIRTAASFAPTDLVFYTYNNGLAERLRIASTGAATFSSATGDVNTLSANNSNATNPYGLALVFSGASPNNTTQYFISASDNVASRFIVYSNGNAVNTNGSYGAISDIKLKENIADATPKLEKLLKVKIRNYNLIGEETKQIGVIAQELEEIFPSLIDESEDFEEVEVPQIDEEGNEVLNEDGEVLREKKRVSKNTTTKSVKYSVFVPMLIKAMQEQQVMIQELNNRIIQLENK